MGVPAPTGKAAVNKALERLGSNPSRRPLFRVVWSDDETEMRRGTFEEHYGKVYVRTVQGVKEVPKYPYVKSRWVLERWFPTSAGVLQELPDSRGGVYEPIFVLKGPEGQFLPLNEEVVTIVAQLSLYPDPASKIKQRSEDAIKAQEEREVKEIRDSFDDVSPLVSKMHSTGGGREAIVVPEIKQGAANGRT
jgi:hypothetical protein